MMNFREVKSTQIVKISWDEKPCKRNYGSLKNDVRPCVDNEYFNAYIINDPLVFNIHNSSIQKSRYRRSPR